MIESPIGSIQKVESNCNKKLEIFISNLNRHANTLKKNVSQLQQISARLLAKSQQFVRLNETEYGLKHIFYLNHSVHRKFYLFCL